MKRWTILAVPFLLSGCATELTAGGKAVPTYLADPPANCVEVGFIEFADSRETWARNHVRNEAATRGANYLRMESTRVAGNLVTVSGTAFRCP